MDLIIGIEFLLVFSWQRVILKSLIELIDFQATY